MWIITEKGFYSIVEKPTDRGRDTLTVRARVKDDLVAFTGLGDVDVPIQERRSADYRFRAEMDRDVVAEIIAAQVQRIRYSNFKERVRVAQGFERAHLYSDVWGTLYSLQE